MLVVTVPSLCVAVIGVKAVKASGDEYVPVFGYYIQDFSS